MPSPVSGYISNSNYYSFDGSNENLTLGGINLKLGQGSNLSIGAGADWTIGTDGASNVNPALEVKYKQNLGHNLNAQVRFREIDGAEQYRVTFGGSHAFNNNNSIYGAAHFTSKYSNGEWGHKTGAWVGYTHNFRGGVSVSAELQQNINIGKPNNIWDMDGNKSLNVIVSIPIN
ncbi:MAG: hypothetical protein K6E29_00590 [Cyanobacteria bacterium RUI128]|nr:hypothetical protein [Cyanobacteria bacterium RUI128]